MSDAEANPDIVDDHNIIGDSVAGDETNLPLFALEHSTGIVHDLGNLIQVALSGLNRVARNPGIATDPDLEPVIASIKAALHSAGMLVRETIGRTSERYREYRPTDVSACLTKVETLVRSTWGPDIRLDVRIGAELPFARCDCLGLQNAILNLVFNARDAMPDGGLISIAATAVNQGTTASIELRIEDSGIGMTAESRVRALDPFFTTKGRGLGGVGLPMVKHFAEEHGGSIDIESAFGAGTTVILRVPAVAMATDTHP